MRRIRQALASGVAAGVVAMATSGCGAIEGWHHMMQGSGTVGSHDPGHGDGAAIQPGPLSAFDLSGSLRSSNGSQAQMTGWIVTMTDAENNSGRVAEVDSAGLFRLLHVQPSRIATLTLLSPDYILSSVVSIPPGVLERVVKQYFRPVAPQLPTLTQRGPIVHFEGLEGIEVARLLASDANGDGVPDGMAAVPHVSDGYGFSSFSTYATADSDVDLDLDGIPNERDPDIDGDGVANVFDADDNGNGVIDPLDGDANGDLVNDSRPGENDSDQHFAEGVEFVAVQVVKTPRADGSAMDTTLIFTTKLRDGIEPLSVQIRGAASLLNGSNYISKDEAGNDTLVAWNRLLTDDGVSSDGNAYDRVFGQRVLLEKGKSPRIGEVVFFQLAFGQPDAPWYMEFPYTFSLAAGEPVTAQYESNTRSVRMFGNPFGEGQDFLWTASIHSDSGQLLWTSQALSGLTRTLQIPANVLVRGHDYRLSVTASTFDRIPGYPGYIVVSPEYVLRN